MLKRVLILSVLAVVLLFVAGGIITVVFGYRYLSRLSDTTQIPTGEVVKTIKSSVLTSPQVRNRRFNFLLAGLDRRNDQLEQTLLTDSLIFASYLPRKAEATLIPIPRDLWIPDAKAKINSLYLLGRNAGLGNSLLINSVASISGQSVDRFLIIDYQLLPGFIDLLGGVDVTVERSFFDPKFPNPAYITDPTAPMYQTVSFDTGVQHMDGMTAVTFMRSRNSPDPAEGSDTARSARQLKVISAMSNKLTRPDLLSQPEKIGRILKYFLTTFETDLTFSDLVNIGLATLPNTQPRLTTITIPENLLINPPITKYGQWVFETPTADFSTLTDFFNSQLL